MSRLIVLAVLAFACSGGDLVLPDEGTPGPGKVTRLTMIAGDGQSAAVGGELPNALVVRLFDESDNAVPDQAVTWLVTAGGGVISPADDVTDVEGRSAARWRLGSSAGRQAATAVVSGIGVVEFAATATRPPGDNGGGGGGGGNGGSDPPLQAARIAIARGNGQTAAAGSAVPMNPAVIVTDASGGGVSGVAVTFQVIDGGGHITNAGSETDASGVASVGSWTLGESGGTNKVLATARGSGIAGNPVTFTATGTVIPKAPDRLVFLVQPSRVAEDNKMSPAVQVAVVDDQGNIVAGHRGEVQLELRRDGGGGEGERSHGGERERLRGDTRRSFVQGVATFADLRVDREGDGYRLRASASGFTPVESSAFDIIDD